MLGNHMFSAGLSWAHGREGHVHQQGLPRHEDIAHEEEFIAQASSERRAPKHEHT